MGYTWIIELSLTILDIYFWLRERRKKPLPKIVGSVPYVPLKK